MASTVTQKLINQTNQSNMKHLSIILFLALAGFMTAQTTQQYALGLVQYLSNQQQPLETPQNTIIKSINADFKITTPYAEAAIQINANVQTLIRAIRNYVPAGKQAQFVNPRRKALAGYTVYFVELPIPYQIMIRVNPTRPDYYQLLIDMKAIH